MIFFFTSDKDKKATEAPPSFQRFFVIFRLSVDKSGSMYYNYNNIVLKNQQTVLSETICFQQYDMKLSEIRQNQKQTIYERRRLYTNGG